MARHITSKQRDTHEELQQILNEIQEVEDPHMDEESTIAKRLEKKFNYRQLLGELIYVIKYVD